MIERYSREEITNIWKDKNKYSIWLNIELAAAEAMEKFKIIPKGVSRKVKSKAKINVKRILKIEDSHEKQQQLEVVLKKIRKIQNEVSTNQSKLRIKARVISPEASAGMTERLS